MNPEQDSKKVTIGQIKLDSFLNENAIIPDFIKIDVDGYELEVLKGLEETIKKYHPAMVVEYNDQTDVVDFLKSFNYTLLDMDLKEFESIPVNIFCVNKS